MNYTSRNDVPEKYKWDLTPLFASDEEWEVKFAELKKDLPSASAYVGKLADPDKLAEVFVLSDEISLRFEWLYVYANLKCYEDAREGKYQQMVARIGMCAAELSATYAFVTPEIIASYTKEQLIELSKDPRFAAHSHELVELARQKEHILTDKEERILAQAGTALRGYSAIFSRYDNADIKWNPVKVDGKKVPLSHGVYGELMLSPDRRVRKDAHNSMMQGYKDMINTISATYAGNIQADVFYAQVRGYKSCLARALDNDNLPEKVYTNLIRGVHRALPTLKAYLGYRKDKLGIRSHKAYDMYVNLEEAHNKKYEFDESFDMVLEGLAPLGEDYIALLKKARDERWIDVYETPGKRSGGFSWGTYGSPAYIMLNYNGTLSETFTIAHELGHSMHSYFSDHAQPYASAGYRIFVAEIASTVNEMILIKSLLKKAGPEEKKFLLGYQLDMFKSTIFRQTLFAEFEMQAHQVVEQGGGLSPDVLCDIYEKLIIKYYGKQFVTPMIRYEWARIPHFYTSYYVFKYATGLISACAIASDIMSGKEGAVENYMKFLSAGGSMDPLDILRLAGVDLMEKAPFDKAMQLFKDTLDELVALE